jgi:hypothetical protein
MTDNNPQKAMFEGEDAIEDPEAFNRRQRFQEIHAARQRVADMLAEDDELYDTDGEARGSRERMASVVALYVMELKPLLKHLDAGVEYGSDELGDTSAECLGHFAYATGRTRNVNGRAMPAPIMTSMQVYQVANQAYAELGMELDLTDGNKDASFDYSDLLDDDAQPTEPPEIVEK